jgi:hypothetical protein
LIFAMDRCLPALSPRTACKGRAVIVPKALPGASGRNRPAT